MTRKLLLTDLDIEICPVKVTNRSQARRCHGIIDVRSLGSRSRSGDQSAYTKAFVNQQSVPDSCMSDHDGLYLQSIECLAQSVEISEFFKVLGPTLRSAALRALLQGTAAVVLGIGCNDARHCSPAAACLAAHCLRPLVAHVEINSKNVARACGCIYCNLGLGQNGMIDVVELCQAAFNDNFRFEGVTARRVAILGLHDSVASPAVSPNASLLAPPHGTPDTHRRARADRNVAPNATHAGPARQIRSRSPVLRQLETAATRPQLLSNALLDLINAPAAANTLT